VASGWPGKGHVARLKNSLYARKTSFYARFDPRSSPKHTVFGAIWSLWSPIRSHFRLGADFFNGLAISTHSSE